MAMEKRNNKEEITVDWAYNVIDSIVEAADQVSAKPEMGISFLVSLQKAYPDLLDALLAITEENHRLKVVELIRAVARMTGVCLQTMRK